MKILKILTILFAIVIANDICSQTVSIDRTFGENGFIIFPQNEYSPGGISHLKYDNYNNIISVGSNSPTENIISYPTILKTDANGILDQNFGNNGVVTLIECFTEFEFLYPEIYGVKITNENKIILILNLNNHGYITSGETKIIIRLNENGSIDETFGNNGIIVLDSINNVFAINIENDDFMLVADFDSYYDNNGNHLKPFISKYNYNGEIDSDFGENGKAYLTDNETFRIFPSSIKILSNGFILVAGYDDINTFAKLAFCKLNQQGNFVTDFADNGICIMSMNNNYRKWFLNVIETNSGNLVLTGKIVDDLFICGFNSNGTINQNFGENGFFYYSTLATNNNQTFLQNGDKYLIREGKQIVSINNNGTFDTHFNNNGFYFFEDFHTTTDMKFQNTDKIIIGGVDNYYGNLAMTRITISSDVSIKEIDYSEKSSIIFPNPTNDILHFKTEKQFKIFDVQGKLLLKSEEFTNLVNISYLTAGIYFIKFEDNKVEKFVKK